jgi:hypothetical protein
MKRIICSLILFLVAGILIAQDGYQEYTFGMDMDTVKAKWVQLNQRDRDFKIIFREDTSYFESSCFFYIIKHLYNSELSGGIPNPMAARGDEFKVLKADSDFGDRLTFFFSNNKLVGVVTKFYRSNILSEIIKKYGNGNKYSISWSENSHDLGIVWQNGQRYIIWEEFISDNIKREVVTYIEVNWSRELCQRRMESFRAEQQKVRSRID